MGVPIALGYREDAASGAQIVDGGLRFDSGKSNYLSRTFGSGNTNTWTWAGWIKKTYTGTDAVPSGDGHRGIFTARSSGTNYAQLSIGSSGGSYGNYIRFLERDGSGVVGRFDTTQVFRDPSSWFHLVLVWDSSNGTSGDRIRLYINGVRVTAFSTATYPTSSANSVHNTAIAHNLGYDAEATAYLDGYLSNINFIDGQALGPGYFGYTDPLTNVWRPKKFRAEGTTVNDGTVWSDYLSSTGALTAETSGFNGDVSVGAYSSDSSPITFTPPNAIRYQTLRVYTGTGSGTNVVSLDGGSDILLNNNAWTTVSETGGSFTTLTVDNTAGSAGTRINAIEVDGVIMLDSTTQNLDFGTNGFYLPFDGSAPIGQDQSGRGNNWTPVNFGGSNTLEKATGALPILNTDGGGKVARVGVRTDVYYTNLKLAVPFVGVATDVVQQINGNSATMTSFTANNATFAVHPTAGAPYSNGLYLNNVSDYPNVNFSAGTFNFLHNQTGNGTVEFWMYNGSYTDEASMLTNTAGSPDVGFSIQMASSTTLQAVISRGVSGSSRATGTANVSQNTWHHIAVTKQIVGSNCELKVYVNGVLSASNTSITASDLSNSNSSYSYFRIGQNIGDEGGRGWTNYYMNDLRIYDTVKYTSNFIPASTDPDIVPDSPSGVSYSSNLTQITDGAVAFQGTSGAGAATNYLNAGTSSDFTIGTSDNFTFEAFIYPTSVSDTSVFSIGSSTTFAYRIISGSPYLYLQTTGGILNTGTISANKWTHIAITRNSGTLYSFIDGVLVGSVANTSSFDASTGTGAGTFIGAANLTVASPPNYSFTGHISNLHWVKGTALYTSNFTPPSAPITAVENTKLLCCQSNTSAADFTTAPGDGISTQIYSAGITTGTALNASGSTGWVQAFDGSTSTLVYPGDSNGSTEITLQTPVSWSSTIRIYAGQNGTAGTNIIANGVNLSALHTWASGGDWQDVTSSLSSPLTSLKLINVGGQASNIRAVEIDGTVLTDAIVRNGNAAATNFNPFTVDIDTQRGKQSGYCTLNPLNKKSTMTLSNGNLTASCAIDGSAHMVGGTIGVSAGKWYWEYDAVRATGGGWEPVVYTDPLSPITTAAPSNTAYAWTVNGNDGNLRHNNSVVVTDYFDNISDGDHIACALDMDNGKVWFAKNGIWGNGGNPASNDSTGGTGLTGTWYPAVNVGSDSGAASATANFGQKPFKFPPPPGFQPLTLANLPRPSSVRPDQYVGIVTYTGNGTIQTISGLNFSPDFAWIKRRDLDNYHHEIHDTVRPINKALFTSLANAEDTRETVTSFNSDGFVVSTQNGEHGGTNASGGSYVAWAWKAGGNSNTYNINDVGYSTAEAAGLTAGTITPTGVSVNTKNGFSIVSFTSDSSTNIFSVPHGLSNTPKFVIVKSRDNGVAPWYVYHSSLATDNYLRLNGTNATASDGANQWGNGMTSSVIGLRAGYTTVASTATIAYAWAEIPGFSKFGSYTGNGSADGPVVITGFSPKWILIKNISNATQRHWAIIDTARSTYNASSEEPVLFADSSSAESPADNNFGQFASKDALDFLSNGFKVRESNTAAYSQVNLSGSTYIYAAFAEAPTFNLYGAQANAR